MKQRRQKEIQKENETYYSLLREVSDLNNNMLQLELVWTCLNTSELVWSCRRFPPAPPGMTRSILSRVPSPGWRIESQWRTGRPAQASPAFHFLSPMAAPVTILSTSVTGVCHDPWLIPSLPPLSLSGLRTNKSRRDPTHLLILPGATAPALSTSIVLVFPTGHPETRSTWSIAGRKTELLRSLWKLYIHFSLSRNAGNGSATALTNGEANDDFNESGLAENNKINRSNSKSVGGGRDTSRKGRDGDKKGEKDSGKDPLSLTIKLESDVKRLKCDLQLSRNRENDLRDQIVSYMSSKLL